MHVYSPTALSADLEKLLRDEQLTDGLIVAGEGEAQEEIRVCRVRLHPFSNDIIVCPSDSHACLNNLRV